MWNWKASRALENQSWPWTEQHVGCNLAVLKICHPTPALKAESLCHRFAFFPDPPQVSSLSFFFLSFFIWPLHKSDLFCLIMFFYQRSFFFVLNDDNIKTKLTRPNSPIRVKKERSELLWQSLSWVGQQGCWNTTCSCPSPHHFQGAELSPAAYLTGWFWLYLSLALSCI